MDDIDNEESAPYSPSFRIWLCGTFRVERRVGNGYEPVRTTEWGGSSYPRLLLKALLCCPGRQARRDALLEMLWPDAELEQAVQNLNTAVTRLRKVLAPSKGEASLLLTDEDSHVYRLAEQSFLWVDVDTALTRLGEAERRGRTSPEALSLLEEAESYLSKGMILQDEEGQWAAGRRATVEQARYRCRLWLAEAYEQQQMPGQAETILSLLLEEDPTDEDVLARLMLLLHRQGMTQQALRVYERSCEIAASEGLEITEATKNLATQLATGEKRMYLRESPMSHSFLTDEQSSSFPLLSQAITPAIIEAMRELEDPKRNTSFNQPDASMSTMLAKYLERQLTKLLDTLAPGSTHLSVREIVEPDGLFISPLWNLLNAETPSVSLVDYLIECLSKQQRVLLLGEAGQGKTTVLKQVFMLLAQQFLYHPSSFSALPLYIPLREISSFSGTAIEVLWAYIQDEFPLSFPHFVSLVQNHQLVILFDGLDEIRGELTQHTINERVASRLFTLPAVLSCRKSFYESYLSLSALHERYFSKIELQSLTLNASVMRYISVFCQRKQNHAPKLVATIVNTLQSSPRLQSLAQRPLLLTMMLDIFTDQQDTEGQDWSQAKLYQRYTEKWLKYEAAKSGSVLKWNEKLSLMQEIAWAISRTHIPAISPYSLYQNVTFTQRDLFFWLEHMIALPQQTPVFRLVDDLCFRTFFISNDGDTYAFIHKSFQEYFAACYIFEHLRGRNQTVETASYALQQILPVEVVGFLKEMFSTTEFTRYDRDGVISLLVQMYQHHAMNDRASVTIRQNACAYLAYIGTARVVRFLEHTYEQEPNKWVQRGMMVGLALFCQKTTILEQYVEMVQTDPEAASINLGYHLIYYGDQASEDGYYDQGGEHCKGTVRSIFRRLRNERYKNVWALDLVTLRTLLSTRGTQILSRNEQDLSFLNQFLQKNHQDQGKAFQQEQQLLRTLLQGALL